jgi:integrase
MKNCIADMLECYRSEVLPRKKGRNLDYYMDRLVSDQLAKLDPLAVTPLDIRKFRDRRLESTGKICVRHEMALLSHAFTWAVSEWGLERKDNPVLLVKKPPANPARTRRLSEEEWGRFWTAVQECRTPWFRYLVKLALATTMRKSELIGITWDRVSTTARMVTVDGKTGNRHVPLSREALGILEEWKRVDPLSYQGRVFKVTENAVNLVFRRVCDRSHIHNFRFHDLRHEGISRYMERGDLTPQEVMTISGHKTLAMLSRYTHLRISTLADRL